MPRRVVRSRGISVGLVSRSVASLAAVSAFALSNAASLSVPSSIAALYAAAPAAPAIFACSASLCRSASDRMCSRLDSINRTVWSNPRRSIFSSARMFTSVASARVGWAVMSSSRVLSARSGLPIW